MAWDKVGKKSSGGSTDFLRLKADDRAVFRMLDEEPTTIRQHKLSQSIDGEEKFVTIQCAGDECFICERAKTRFPPQDVWAANVLVLEGLEDQKEPVVRVLTGGTQIWSQMKALYDEAEGEISSFDIVLKRQGKGKEDTQYIVTAAPKSRAMNMANVMRDIADDMKSIEALFPVLNAEEQEAAVKAAGVDIDYDPVAELMQVMSLEEAWDIEVPFGKYKGRTIKNLFISDPRYLTWMAQNVTSNVKVGAAARLVVESGMKKKTAATKASAPQATPAPAGKKAAGKKEAAAKPQTQLQKITDHLANVEPYASDVNAVAGIIKEFGGGQRRLANFSEEAMQKLAKKLKIK